MTRRTRLPVLSVKALFSAFILPPFGLLALALFGLLLSKRHPRCGRALSILSIVTLMLLSTPLVGNNLLRSLESDPRAADTALKRAQAVVVLGSGVYSDSPEYGQASINQRTLERIRYGSYLQAKTGLPLLVSGGSSGSPPRRPEAAAMKEAIERDFHGSVRWTESASRDTAENARYSAAILKPAGVHCIALVSHAWHLPRAMALFTREGLEVIPAPTVFTPPPDEGWRALTPSVAALEKSYFALHEWAGILANAMLQYR